MDYSEYTRDQLIDAVIETLSGWGVTETDRGSYRRYYLNDLMPRVATGEGLHHSAIEDIAEVMRWRLTPEELRRLPELVADRLLSRSLKPPDPVGHWDTPSSPVITEEIVAPARRVEGATSRVFVNAYERNPAAREACIQRHGVRCAVCGFDFGAVYGDLGKGFIHVHHLVPLAAVKREYVVDPDADLRPVCPNCHAMLHRHSTVLSIDELNALLTPGDL